MEGEDSHQNCFQKQVQEDPSIIFRPFAFKSLALLKNSHIAVGCTVHDEGKEFLLPNVKAVALFWAHDVGSTL